MRSPSSLVLALFFVTCGLIFEVIACAGVDRHPCDWGTTPAAAQSENEKTETLADCDAYAYPATSPTNGSAL